MRLNTSKKIQKLPKKIRQLVREKLDLGAVVSSNSVTSKNGKSSKKEKSIDEGLDKASPENSKK